MSVRSLWCRFVGHRWGAYSLKSAAPFKRCDRCGLVADKPGRVQSDAPPEMLATPLESGTLYLDRRASK